eukprot:4786758-Amphidinium_carterae.1
MHASQSFIGQAFWRFCKEYWRATQASKMTSLNQQRANYNLLTNNFDQVHAHAMPTKTASEPVESDATATSARY